MLYPLIAVGVRAYLPAALLLVVSPLTISAPGTSLSDSLNCQGQWATSALCQERERATDARSRLEALLQSVEPTIGSPLGESLVDPQALIDLRTTYDQAVELYRNEYYGDSIPLFETAYKSLTGIQNSLEKKVQVMTNDAQSAMDADNYEHAEALYSDLIKWLPESESAVAGLERAQQGQAQRLVLDEAMEQFNAGDTESAAVILGKIAVGFFKDEVGNLRNRIDEIQRAEKFRQLMTRGYRNLDAGNLEQAEQAFVEASQVDPQSTVTEEVIRNVRQRIAKQQGRVLLVEMDSLLEQEDFVAALGVARQIQALAVGTSLPEGEIARLESIIEVESRLDEFLLNPERLGKRPVRDRARLFLAEFEPASHGDRITNKRNRLQEEFTLRTTRVLVTVYSDNKTEIRLRPGTVIGRFKQRQLHVLPGSYKVVGRRKGYREEVANLEVLLSGEPIEIRVECDEHF